MNKPFNSIKMHRIISKCLERVISYGNQTRLCLLWCGFYVVHLLKNGVKRYLR